jgi:hypothetical protein
VVFFCKLSISSLNSIILDLCRKSVLAEGAGLIIHFYCKKII